MNSHIIALLNAQYHIEGESHSTCSDCHGCKLRYCRWKVTNALTTLSIVMMVEMEYFNLSLGLIRLSVRSKSGLGIVPKEFP
jgi:hypothetical protein